MSGQLRDMTLRDVAAVSQIHCKCLENYSTELGEKYLSIYYRSIIEDEGTIKIVFADNGKVRGFIVGMDNASSFYLSFIKRNWVYLARVSASILLKKPKFILLIMSTMVRRFFKKNDKKKYGLKREGGIEVSGLAVSPECQNQGIGKQLFELFKKTAEDKKYKAISLTTPSVNNEKVVAFYQNLGFKKKAEKYTSGNRLLIVFEYELESFS